VDLFGLLFAAVLVTIIVFALREPLRRMYFASHWDVFVSHRSSDNDIILPIVKELRARGLRVWIDLNEISNDKGVDRFRYPISVGLQQSKCVLLFTSEAFCRSDYCRQEVVFCLKRFRRRPQCVIEVLLDHNQARRTFGIPDTSPHLGYRHRETGPHGQEVDRTLIDEIIVRIQEAGIR
jgi:hypothetical protein